MVTMIDNRTSVDEPARGLDVLDAIQGGVAIGVLKIYVSALGDEIIKNMQVPLRVGY